MEKSRGNNDNINIKMVRKLISEMESNGRK